MKKAYILGLGESLKYFKNKEGVTTFGVNDIWASQEVDYVLTLEPPKEQRTIDTKRLANIIKAKPKKFFSQYQRWKEHFPDSFQKIEICGKLNLDNKDVVSCHNNSPYAACSLAYNMGFNDLVMYGVDFNNHKLLHLKHTIDNIIERYEILNKELNKRGAKLRVGHASSILSKVLEVEDNVG